MKTSNHHSQIQSTLAPLKLPWMREQYERLHEQALKKQTSSLEYLSELLRGEAQARCERAAERRIKAARQPVAKTLDSFNWGWPESIDRPQVEHLASLRFIEHKHKASSSGRSASAKHTWLPPLRSRPAKPDTKSSTPEPSKRSTT